MIVYVVVEIKRKKQYRKAQLTRISRVKYLQGPPFNSTREARPFRHLGDTIKSPQQAP